MHLRLPVALTCLLLSEPATAEITIVQATISSGELRVSGRVIPARVETVSLDERYSVRTDANGTFAFRIPFHPPSCVVEIKAGNDRRAAVISGCAQIPREARAAGSQDTSQGPPGPQGPQGVAGGALLVIGSCRCARKTRRCPGDLAASTRRPKCSRWNDLQIDCGLIPRRTDENSGSTRLWYPGSGWPSIRHGAGDLHAPCRSTPAISTATLPGTDMACRPKCNSPRKPSPCQLG